MTTYNFNIKQGTDFPVDFRCKDGSGQVVDLTGYGVEFRAVSGSVAISRDTADLLSTDQALGMIHLILRKADTRTIPIGEQMRWAIEVTEPDTGYQTVIIEGFIIGEQGIDNVD